MQKAYLLKIQGEILVCGDARNDPPQSVKSFVAQVIILNHPGKIKKGYCPVVDCHTVNIACRFEELKQEIDRRTGEVIEEQPTFLKSVEAGIVRLVPTKPMCIETFQNYPSLGIFSIRDIRQIIGVGIIKEIENVQPSEEVQKTSRKK